MEGAVQRGYVKCNEIVSEGSASGNSTLGLNDFTDQITIDVNYVEGNSPQVVYSFGSSTNPGNFVLKNAKIKNKNTSTSSKGILLQNIYPIVTLRNVKIVSGSDTGSNIFLASGTSIDVNNYGLFGNAAIQGAVNLKIGPKPGAMGYNYQCIIDGDLT